MQGPSRRVSGLIGSRGPNKVAQPPAPKTPKTPGKFTPKKPGMRGGGNLRNMGVAALAGALATGSLRNPVSKAKEKELRKKEAAAGKKRPMPSMGKDYKKKKKKNLAAKQLLLTLTKLLPKHVGLAKKLLRGVVNGIQLNSNK